MILSRERISHRTKFLGFNHKPSVCATWVVNQLQTLTCWFDCLYIGPLPIKSLLWTDSELTSYQRRGAAKLHKNMLPVWLQRMRDHLGWKVSPGLCSPSWQCNVYVSPLQLLSMNGPSLVYRMVANHLFLLKISPFFLQRSQFLCKGSIICVLTFLFGW